MATEPVSKPPSLPPYPEMIMGAIDALKEKDGSSKSAIGRHIEATYGDLPAGHMNSLTEHLNKLKEDGELAFAKNNYMRPDPNAPPKRGRGRPPKAKDLNASEVPSPAAAPAAPAATPGSDGPSRGRGRPRKDPNAPPSVKKAKTEKPKEDDKEEDKEDPAVSKSGRPRGRPRKVQPALAQNGVEAN